MPAVSRSCDWSLWSGSFHLIGTQLALACCHRGLSPSPVPSTVRDLSDTCDHLQCAVTIYFYTQCIKFKRTDLKDCAPPWVYDTQSLVLADGTDSTAVLVPADAVDQVWVGISQLVHKLPSAHVPHANHIITTWREENTACNEKVLLHKTGLLSLLVHKFQSLL